MKNVITILFSLTLLTASSLQAGTTTREVQFETPEVKVWKTTIYPHQPLAMHRHDSKRIVVPLTDTVLTVTNDQGKSHKLVLKRGKAYLLNPDKPGELHVDINESNYPMEVMIVQFKK